MKTRSATDTVSAVHLDTSAPDFADALVTAWERRMPDVDATAVPVFSMATAVGKQVELFLETVLKPYGFQLTDYRVLVALYTHEQGSMTPVRLNSILRQTSAGITKTITRVEQRGLVRRTPNPDDSRSVIIELTDQGEREIQQLCAVVAREKKKKLAWLSDEQQKTVLEGLQTLLQALY